MIDLRSDTVTRPTEGMRRAMLEAPVGDDVFGEDPTVNRLEEYVADLLGKEASLYAPSGTMTNQVGVQVNTNRGEEVLLHEGSHIFVYEAGAPAMLSSVQLRILPGENGILDPETVRAAVRPADVHFPRSRLLCLKTPTTRREARFSPSKTSPPWPIQLMNSASRSTSTGPGCSMRRPRPAYRHANGAPTPTPSPCAPPKDSGRRWVPCWPVTRKP